MYQDIRHRQCIPVGSYHVAASQDLVQTAEALRVADAYEKLGAGRDPETCRELLRTIREAMKNQATIS